MQNLRKDIGVILPVWSLKITSFPFTSSLLSELADIELFKKGCK